jgi:hypothetical protein
MTLQTCWVIRGNKHYQENDPLITKWIEKLGLQQENIIIKHESIDGYARITLRYYETNNIWIIGLPVGFDIKHIIHKLGYIWIWNNTGVLSNIKKAWKSNSYILSLAESCVIDNIVFYRFCNMDQEFKDFWFDFLLNELTFFYNGASWDKDLPNMIYRYIVNYFNWNYILPKSLQNKFSNYIMYNLIKRKEEILEKAQINNVNYSLKDFRRLHQLLRMFENIRESNDYSQIQGFINQVLFYFPII